MASARIVDQSGVLHVKGDLTFASVNSLLSQSLPLLARQQTPAIDLAAVQHIDSAGLALLCEWKRCYRTIQFSHLPAKISGMVALSGLEAILS